MKVESTDAVSLMISKVQKPGATAKDTTNSQNSEIRQKNISQLTTFEKRGLPVAERAVIDAIEKANKAILGSFRRFEFSIHEETKEIMVKVIDSETNEVIREIPPEKILDMVARLWEMAGIIVDERR